MYVELIANTMKTDTLAVQQKKTDTDTLRGYNCR